MGGVSTDEWAMARVGGYIHQSEVLLSDPVAMYASASSILPALLARRAAARDKSSEDTATLVQLVLPVPSAGSLRPA